LRAAGKPAGIYSLRDDLARCTFPPVSRLRERPGDVVAESRVFQEVFMCRLPAERPRVRSLDTGTSAASLVASG
jgi:hypothetical protein